MTQATWTELESEVERDVTRALDGARSRPAPDPSTIHRFVYEEPDASPGAKALGGLSDDVLAALPGTTTPAETGDVVRVGWDPRTGQLTAVNGHNWPQPDPRPMTGSEIYNTWFGVDRLTPNPHGEVLRRYLVLAADPFRSTKEQAEVMRLRDQLNKHGVRDFEAPVPRKTR